MRIGSRSVLLQWLQLMLISLAYLVFLESRSYRCCRLLFTSSFISRERYTVVLCPECHVLLLLKGEVISAAQLVLHNVAVKSLTAAIEVR